MEEHRQSDLDLTVVKTLCYFDVFNYPLTIEEIQVFCSYPDVSLAGVGQSLMRLGSQGLVFQFGIFFSLQSDKNNVEKRLTANKEAERWMPLANQKAKLIFSFPFVRSVMVSGSLSKNCMDKDSDLDFFVISSKDRLWLTRAMLTLYKKLFLRNSHKLFCINYYVAEDYLRLRDHNIFTATELVTLIPLFGKEHFNLLFDANKDWVLRHYPNFRSRKEINVSPSPIIKSIIETLLSVIPSRWSESKLMQLTSSYWRKRYSTLSEDEFERSFQISSFAAKAHPDSFQKKVLDLFQVRVKKYTQKVQLQLS